MTIRKSRRSSSTESDSIGKDLKRETSVDLSQATYHTIMDASRNDRLIFGIDAGAELLMNDPDSVFACLLPLDGYEDITTKIYYTLLEAFCNKEGIPLIQVDSASKLSRLLDSTDRKSADCGVVLIRYPDPSEVENVCEYEKEMARHICVYQRSSRPIPRVILRDTVD